jgi:hypothetical protein
MTEGSSNKIFLKKWVRFHPKIIDIQTDDPARQRRGQLLSLYLSLVFLILTNVTIGNLFDLKTNPSFKIYLAQDFASYLMLGFLWVLNRNGRTSLSANIAITISILGAVFTYPPKVLEYSMVLFALPVTMSSFIIKPARSFLFAFLAGAGYTISVFAYGGFAEYNFSAILIILAIALVSFIAAWQLESTLGKNATLLENLQHSNEELRQAYETTLVGWSRALELRDKETEGHTQRVTELTLRLASAAGFSEEELMHIRRGALLHDIGKLGVPDEILYKPGSLTDEEWKAMRQHPQFAYDLLLPILYLQPALAIPHHHHEKWDGSGYPDGLKGREIPLEARIFAIVDVYDALTSVRPYREAWSKEKALEKIHQDSGTHFDPEMVELFINVLSHE